MATRTFVADGTSRNWSLGTTWIEGVAPTAADNVVFSTNVAGSALVIDGTSGSPSLCRSIDTTGYTRTITFANAKQLNVGDGTAGAFKMTAGMTFSPGTTSLVKFVSTTTGNNITFGGYFFGNLTFDGVGGAWAFQDTNTMLTDQIITLTNGSLDTNSKSQSNALFFSSNNSNTRSLTLGTTNFTCSASGGTVWDIGTSTGMTLSAASSTITLTTAANTATFAGGGLTYGTVTCTTLLAGRLNFTGANTFATLTISKAASTPTFISGYILGANQTVTGTLTANGINATNRNFIYSDVLGTPRTITAATVTATWLDLRDITGAGASGWNLSAITGGSGDCGGNSGITFNTTKNCYMKTAVSVNWSASNWYTTSGGSTLITPAVPLPQDVAVFDANSVTAGSRTITLDVIRLCGFNWTGILNTPAFAMSTSNVEVYGSMIFSASMTASNAVSTRCFGRSSYSINMATLTHPGELIINCTTGTYTFASAFGNSTRNFQIASGSLALGGFNVSTGAIAVSGGALSGTGTISGTTYTQSGGSVTLGGTLTLTGALAVSAGTFDLNNFGVTGHTTFTLSGTGIVNLSGQVNGSSTITVSAGTINCTTVAGEMKGSSANFSGGASVVGKLTLTATLTLSSTASLTLLGNSSYATNWNITGATCTFKMGTTQLVNGAWSIGIDSYTYAC